MGLAISLVAMEKEKVTNCRNAFILKRDAGVMKMFLSLPTSAGVVSRLRQQRQRLLQHQIEGRRGLHHLVQRERGEQTWFK